MSYFLNSRPLPSFTHFITTLTFSKLTPLMPNLYHYRNYRSSCGSFIFSVVLHDTTTQHLLPITRRLRWRSSVVTVVEGKASRAILITFHPLWQPAINLRTNRLTRHSTQPPGRSFDHPSICRLWSVSHHFR